MNTRKVDFYKAEVHCYGSKHSDEDIIELGKAKLHSGDCDSFEFSKILPVNEAFEYDGKIWIDDRHPESSKLYAVWFSYIDDMVEYDDNDDPILTEEI